MRKRTLSKRKCLETTAQIILVATAVWLMFQYAGVYVRPTAPEDIVCLREGWQQKKDPSAAWSDVTEYPSQVFLESKDVLRLRRIVETKEENQTLMIVSIHQRLELFLDGTLLYDNRNSPSGINPGISLHFIPFPNEFERGEVELNIWSPYPIFASSLQPIYMGNLTALHIFAVQESIFPLVFSFICIGSGLFFMCFCMFPSHSKADRWANLFFGVFCINWAIYSVGRVYITYLFFTPLAASKLRNLSYLLYPIFIVAYLCMRIQYYKRTAWFVCYAFAFLALLSLVLTLGFHMDFEYMLTYLNPVHQSLLFVMASITFLETLRKNVFFRFIVPGILLASVCCILTILDREIRYNIFYDTYITAITVVVLMIWVYNIYAYLQKRSKDREAYQILKMKNELTLEYCDTMVQNMKEIKLLRHEINNHASALQYLCREGNLEKITDYVCTLSKLETTTSPVVYSEHFLINCILTSRFAFAHQYKIRVDYQVQVPKELPFPDTDISSLFFNMLNNAIEACVKLPKSERWMSLTVSTKNNVLLIECKNACLQSVSRSGTFRTTKPNKQMHGYGLIAMRKIAEKYGSILHVACDEKQFTLRTMLPISQNIQEHPSTHSNRQ